MIEVSKPRKPHTDSIIKTQIKLVRLGMDNIKAAFLQELFHDVKEKQIDVLTGKCSPLQ